MTNFYQSISRLLSKEFHNEIKSIELRHLNLKNKRIELFKDRSTKEMLPYFDSIAGVLIISFQSALKILNLAESDNFKTALQLLNDFRSENDI